MRDARGAVMKVFSRVTSAVVASAAVAAASFAGAGVAQADGSDRGGRVVQERPANWSGLYFGLHSGWVWSETDAFFPGGNPLLTIVGVAGQGFSAGHDAPIVGGQVGLQHQFGHLVVGVEGSFSSAYQNKAGGDDVCPKQTIALFNCLARFDDVLTVGGRLGWSMGKFLPYVTGGYASARFTELATNKSLAPVGFTIVQWSHDRAQGWYVGGGVDWALAHGWTMGIEYRHYDFESQLGLGTAIIGGQAGGALPNDNAVFNHTADTITMRVSWKLGRPEPAPLK
jgi:opacity protein-like surface antigen